MTPLRQRMIEDMQLRGLSPKTQRAYVRAVRALAEYYNRSPDQISEEELREYFLYLKNERRLSRSSCTVALCGIKLFYEYTLGGQWPVFELIRPKKEKKVPVVLSEEEVRQILNCVRRPHYQVCLSTIYACGLRIIEGTNLQVGDIDSARMQIHVHLGKGNKDRYVPLPTQTASGQSIGCRRRFAPSQYLGEKHHLPTYFLYTNWVTNANNTPPAITLPNCPAVLAPIACINK